VPGAPDPLNVVLGRARLHVLRATVVICLLISLGGLVGAVAGFTAGGAAVEGPAIELAAAWCALWLLAAAFPAITARCFTHWQITGLVLVVANTATVTLTAGIASPILGMCMYIGWITSVVASARAAIGISLLVTMSVVAGYLLAGDTPHDIVAGPDRYTAVCSAVLSVLTGLVGALLASVTNRTFSRVPEILAGLRHGAAATTPALTALISRPIPELPERAAALRDPATATVAPLTTAEREVVRQLADGHTPQEIALQRGVKESTIRSQLKSAKKKTGARTLPHLVVIALADVQ
jgi:DNA-binding CsgD family transcriptional regulator